MKREQLFQKIREGENINCSILDIDEDNIIGEKTITSVAYPKKGYVTYVISSPTHCIRCTIKRDNFLKRFFGRAKSIIQLKYVKV